MGKATLFDRAGGFSAVRKVVMAFYDQVLDSDLVGHHFTNIDMHRLIDHQTKFIASLMGGPAAYSDDILKRAHMHLGINSEEFVEVVEILVETLEDFGFGESDIDAVRRAFITKESFIVCETPSQTQQPAMASNGGM